MANFDDTTNESQPTNFASKRPPARDTDQSSARHVGTEILSETASVDETVNRTSEAGAGDGFREAITHGILRDVLREE